MFRRVYLPQVALGIAAGCLLVFIQSLGVFVTPAILGAQLIRAFPTYCLLRQPVAELGPGSIAIAPPFVTVLVFYWLFTRLTGSSGISMGWSR